MWREALLIAKKDLKIELRSRVTANQIAPFALLVLILFAVAFDADREVLLDLSSGLFWIAVAFSAVLAVQRSFAIESGAGRDGLRMTALDPAGMFIGKAGAVVLQLLLLEILLVAGIVVLYGAQPKNIAIVAVSSLLATVGLATVSTLYAALAFGYRRGETLLPLLILPIQAPVLLAASRIWDSALGLSPDTGWTGVQFLAVFAAVYVSVGVLLFGPILEDA